MIRTKEPSARPLTAVLIDDEPWILEGLAKLFPWDRFGFSLPAKITNPLEGVEYIYTYNPDVVFIDIRMPHIGGLELIEAARAEGIKSEFVIISGYSEFEFAQRAFREGVFDYCLKPVSAAYAEDLLLRLCKHLEKKKLPQPDGGELYELIGAVDGITPGSLVSVIVESDDSPRFRSRLPEYRHLLGADGMVFLNRNSFLFFLPGRLDGATLMEMVCVADPALEAHWGVVLHGEDEQIEDSIRQAELAVMQAVFFMQDTGVAGEYQKPDYQKIISRENAGFLDGGFDQVRRLFYEMAPTMEESIFFWNELAASINRDFAGSGDERMEFLGYHQFFYKFRNAEGMLADLERWFLRRKEILEGTEDAAPTETGPDTVGKIIVWIRENYLEILHLEEIALNFKVNYTYLSGVFKERTGMTFTRYVNSLRIEEAQRLMMETNLSLADIAYESGYNDYFYFNRIFRKMTGVPPGEFRKRKEG